MGNINYETELKLFEENAGLVRHTIKRYFPDFMNDEDILQEAFIGLWKACNCFNEKLGAFSTIAVKCISNSVLKELARRKKWSRVYTMSYDDMIPDHENLNFADTLVDPAGSPEDYGIVVKDFFDSLNECDQKVLMLRITGVGQAEAAKSLGFSQSNYSKKLNRIRGLYEQYVEES